MFEGVRRKSSVASFVGLMQRKTGRVGVSEHPAEFTRGATFGERKYIAGIAELESIPPIPRLSQEL